MKTNRLLSECAFKFCWALCWVGKG